MSLKMAALIASIGLIANIAVSILERILIHIATDSATYEKWKTVFEINGWLEIITLPLALLVLTTAIYRSAR